MFTFTLTSDDIIKSSTYLIFAQRFHCKQLASITLLTLYQAQHCCWEEIIMKQTDPVGNYLISCFPYISADIVWLLDEGKQNQDTVGGV